jgi:hypothetical protein
VHAAALNAVPAAVERRIGLGDLVEELAGQAGRAFQRIHIGRRHHHLGGDVQADGGQRPRRGEDQVGGFRIVPDIGLGHRRDITRLAGHAERAAHDHHSLEQGSDLGIGLQGQGEIGQRADGDQGHLAGMLARDVDDRPVSRLGLGLSRDQTGQLDITQAVLAVHEGRRRVARAGQRLVRALVDRRR